MIFNINRFIIDHIFILLAGLIVLITAIKLYGRSISGRYQRDRLKLYLPVWGPFLQKIALVHICQNLAIAVRGGMRVAPALEVIATASGNKVLEKALGRVRERHLSGSDLAASFAAEDLFPQLFVRMIKVGESTGRLSEVLDDVAGMYERQAETQTTIFLALLEPVLIIFMGIVVFILLLAVYLPIFNLIKVAKGI